MNKERSLLLQSQWFWTWVVNEFAYYLDDRLVKWVKAHRGIRALSYRVIKGTKLVVFGYC